MRQLITRIDDALHARLKDVAQRQGRPVNAVVVEALEQALSVSVGPRAMVRRAARERDLVVFPPHPATVVPRDEVIARTRGAGLAVSDALAAERAAR